MDYRERDRQVELFHAPASDGGAKYLVGTDAAGEGVNLQFCWLMVANFGVSDRRFRFKPAGGFGGNRQAVSVQSGTPLRMGFGPDFGEPPLRDTSYLALACQSKYSCHYL